MTYRNTKLRNSARGQDCQLRIPGVCNGNPETVVWCHLNGQEYGKGLGHKPHDIFGFYGCSACHDVYDGRTRFVQYYVGADGNIEKKLSNKNATELAISACLRSLRIAADMGVL